MKTLTCLLKQAYGRVWTLEGNNTRKIMNTVQTKTKSYMNIYVSKPGKRHIMKKKAIIHYKEGSLQNSAFLTGMQHS